MPTTACAIWTVDNLTRIYPHTPAPHELPTAPEVALTAACGEREAKFAALKRLYDHWNTRPDES